MVWRRPQDTGWKIFGWLIIAVVGGIATGALIAFLAHNAIHS